MSISSARPSQIQSNPTMPPGATRTYAKVTQGRNRKPSNGTRKLSGKASCQRNGWTSHQTRMAARGPMKISTVQKQHMTIPPFVSQHYRSETAGDQGACEFRAYLALDGTLHAPISGVTWSARRPEGDMNARRRWSKALGQPQLAQKSLGELGMHCKLDVRHAAAERNGCLTSPHRQQ